MIELDRDALLALGGFDDATRALVRAMVADGFQVADAWGPVQMAVAHLELARDGQHVAWHTERGFNEPALVWHDDPAAPRARLVVATIAWARGREADGRVRAPGIALPTRRSENTAILLTHWRSVLEWLPTADAGRLERIDRAWWTEWPFGHVNPGDDAQIAEWAARVEATAAE